MSRILYLGNMLRNKKISCVELTDEYLNAAKKNNPELNAYIMFTGELALKKACEVDEKLLGSDDLSPLSGIPFILKDNIATMGIKTTCASKMLSNHIPVYDATVWECLKEQDAVLIGKGNLDEMSMGSDGSTSYFGQILNPCDVSRIPGGSSGGTAAAVGAGTAVFGIGTDTGGSIRQPASYCGLVGLKPTYGAVSRYGLFALSSSLDTIGPITTSVKDAAIVFDAISKYDKRDMRSVGSLPMTSSLTDNIRGMRIGVVREFFKIASNDVVNAVNNALKILEDRGAVITDIEFPLMKYSLAAYHIISRAEAASNFGRFDGIRFGYRPEKYSDVDDLIKKSRSEGFGSEVKRRLITGTYLLSSDYINVYYKKAIEYKNALINEYKKLFQDYDCIITPTEPSTAMKINSNECSENNYDDICLTSVNIAGIPAVTVPCGFDADGLPIGFQVIGDKFCESKILSAALAFETETDGCFIYKSESGVAL